MLDPEDVGPRGALNHSMHVLDPLIASTLRRHVFGIHSLRREVPSASAIVRLPDTSARDGNGQMLGVSGIHADRIDGWLAGTAAEPLLSFRRIPQRLDEGPGLAVILRKEKTSRDSAAPDHAGLVGAACLKGKERGDARPVLIALLLFEGGSRDLRPALSIIRRSLQLDAEMSESLSRVKRPIARIAKQHRDGIAEEGGLADLPSLAFAADVEEPLASSQ
jgi:hypothetical protein